MPTTLWQFDFHLDRVRGKQTAEHAERAMFRWCGAGRRCGVATMIAVRQDYGANNGTGSLHALWPAGPTDATRNQYLRPLLWIQFRAEMTVWARLIPTERGRG